MIGDDGQLNGNKFFKLIIRDEYFFIKSNYDVKMMRWVARYFFSIFL